MSQSRHHSNGIRWVCVGIASVVNLTWFAPSASAQKNNTNAAQERRDDQRVQAAKADVKQAQEKLKDDQKDLLAAQKAAVEAEAKHKAARQQLDELRKRVESKIESAAGIDKALAGQDAAQKDFDAAAVPVLKTLKETSEYQAAAKKATEADARLKSLHANESISDEAKRKEIAQASKEKSATRQLEQAALDADSSTKSAQAKLAEAHDRVKQLRAKIRSQIESDPDLLSSMKAMRSAAEAADDAVQKMQRLREKVAADSAKLAREQQQVMQAEAADKANDGSNKNGKKPNNKK